MKYLIVVLALTTSACGDLYSATSPSRVIPTSPCQTAGSTVNILDQIPGCHYVNDVSVG